MTTRCRAALTVALVVVTTRAGNGSTQTTPDATLPRFDVASVKPNKSGLPYVGAAGDSFSNGQFRTSNIPLRLLLRQAFRRWRDSDVVGGPAWLDTERWDIAAKATSPEADLLPMIRALLADRFGLRYHLKAEEGPIYALVLARRDNRLGPSLRPQTGVATWLGTTGRITGVAIHMSDLVVLLGAEMGRHVVDRTGLDATYNVNLVFAPTLAGSGSTPFDVPDIFTALQEQLGLKLEATRGPVETMVIDAVARPEPD